MPGAEPVAERLSDMLVGARLNWNPRWAFEGNVQFNPKNRESVRTTLSTRYTPGDYRVLSAAYRLQVAQNLLQRFWLEGQGLQAINLESVSMEAMA